MKRPWALLFIVVLSAMLAVGCARAHKTAMNNARTSLDQAKAMGVQEKAPLEYYTAESYLRIAEEEVTEGDYKGAKEFAEKSQKASAEAMKKAGGGAK